MMLARSLALSVLAATGALVLVPVASSCRALEPPNRPLDACGASCRKHASRQCSEDECARGCELILDRIIEREADKVIACVARADRRCADLVWAECAAHVGPHADGGPPPPPPPPEDE